VTTRRRREDARGKLDALSPEQCGCRLAAHRGSDTRSSAIRPHEFDFLCTLVDRHPRNAVEDPNGSTPMSSWSAQVGEQQSTGYSRTEAKGYRSTVQIGSLRIDPHPQKGVISAVLRRTAQMFTLPGIQTKALQSR
jgi:hypothetical protein